MESRPDAIISLRTEDGLRLGERYRIPTMWCAAGTEVRWPEHIAAWLERYVQWGHQTVAVVADDERAPEVKAVLQLVAQHHHRCRQNQHTIEKTGATWGLHFLETIKRGPAWATQFERPWRGLPAFIVAAGPSLDGNGHLLAEARRRGPVVAVNTSLSAVLQHGVVPDLVVCVESKDMSEALKSAAGLGIQVALDAVSHPNNWAACPDALAFASHEPATVPYLLALGQRPVSYSGSVACAAAALAILWSASPIVLVGQDLAYTGGRMYALGTPYEDMRCEDLGGVVHFSGHSKTLHSEPALYRDAWGGEGRVLTRNDLASFAQWFELAADAQAVWNCTEGGVRIKAALEMPLSAALTALRPRQWDAPPLPDKPNYDSVRALLCGEALDVLEDQSPGNAMPLLNLWTAPAILSGQAASLSSAQRAARVAEARRDGAQAVVDAMWEALG